MPSRLAKVGGHRRKSIKTFARTTGRARGWRQRSFRNPLTRNRTPPAFAFHRRCMRRFLCHRNRRLSPSPRTLVQRLFDLSPLVFSAQPSLSPFLVYTGLVARYQVFVAASEFFSFFFFFFFFFRERQRRGGESFSSVTTLFLKREGKMGQVL